VEQFGAWSRSDGVETLPEPALELVRSHGRRIRRRTVAARVLPPDLLDEATFGYGLFVRWRTDRFAWEIESSGPDHRMDQ
jgi:hypothetical protein